MDTILNTLKAGMSRDSFTEVNPSHYLVAYDNELDYTATRQQLQSERTYNSDKLPTQLSRNPSQYEKDQLRDIVLELYSDHVPEHISSPVAAPSYEIVKLQEDFIPSGPSLDGSYLSDEIKNPPILFRYEETALTNNDPQFNMSRHKTTQIFSKKLVDSESIPGSHVSGIDSSSSFTGSQQSLQTFDIENAGGIYRNRFGSTETDVITSSFSDSGIQLDNDTMDNESMEGHSNDLGCTSIDVDDEKSKRDETSAILLASIKEQVGFESEDSSRDQYSMLQVPPIPAELIRTSSPIRTERTTDTSRNIDLEACGLHDSVISKVFTRNEFVDEKVASCAQEEGKLQLEVANMEGRLETLTTEYRKVLEERKQLQEKLKVDQETAKISTENDSHMVKQMHLELERLREKELSLENKLTQLQQTSNDKELYVKDVEEKLRLSQLCVKNLQESLKTLEVEANSKSDGVQALEEELEELKGILSETKLQYEGNSQEKSVLFSDVNTLVQAKSWLMKQLEASKESQVKLQLEVSEYKSTFFEQNKKVEQLKCDNARVVQKLTVTQEKAIKEKAMIIEHLESVENDLVSQDVAFRKMQTEAETVQRELAVKIDSLQKENSLLQNLANSAKKFDEELQSLKTEADAKTNLLKKLNEEKDVIVQQLELSKNVNQACENNIKVLNLELQENAKKLESLSIVHSEKEAVIQDLKQKNSELMQSIREAQAEKDALDGAVQLLRLELDKVERRFKIMKRELTLKANQLEEVSRQKDGFINELRVLRDELELHKTVLETLRDTIRLRDETIKMLENDKVKLHEEARALSESLKTTQVGFDETQKEKEKLYDKLQSSQCELSSLENKLHDSYLEKAKLEGELESTKRASEDYANAKRVEHEHLKEEMNEIQSSLQYEATRNRDEAINLKQEVEYMKGQLTQESQQRKNEVESLEEKLVQMRETKEQEEAELKKHFQTQQRNSVNEVKVQYEKDMTAKEHEHETLKEKNDILSIRYTELEQRARNTATLQQDRIISLEKELHLARNVLEEQKRELEKSLLISIELEREKGRLAGLRTSQKALRDHCANLEESSAKRESKISELQIKLENLTLEKENGSKEAQRKVTQLETSFKANCERIDELRFRLHSQTKENSQLRARLEESEQEAERVLTKLTKTCVELEHTNSKYEKCTNKLQNNNECQQALQMDLQTSQMLVRKLENELRTTKEQEKVKDDLISALEWKLSQRCKEIEYAKEQLRFSDERHQTEIETLRTAVQVANSEAAYLRRELSLARKSKCESQEKYFTSKNELLAARQETETVKQDLFAASQQLRYLKSAILNSCNVKELQDFVKNEEETSFVTKVTFASTNQKDPDFKSSLTGLRECMSSLRDQISSLQEQMNKHTDSICTTASSWRSFEKNVQNLQSECSSIQRKAQPWLAEKDTGDS